MPDMFHKYLNDINVKIRERGIRMRPTVHNAATTIKCQDIELAIMVCF